MVSIVITSLYGTLLPKVMCTIIRFADAIAFKYTRYNSWNHF